MDDTFLFVIFIGLACVIGVMSIAWSNNRSQQIVESWASRNGYTLLSAEQRHMMRGPFFWTTARGQTVYYITVRDQHGMVRSGWLRCGSWWLGLWSDQADVRWE